MTSNDIIILDLLSEMQDRGYMASDIILESISLCFGLWYLEKARVPCGGGPYSQKAFRELVLSALDSDREDALRAAYTAVSASNMGGDVFRKLLSRWTGFSGEEYCGLLERLLYPHLDNHHFLGKTPDWINRLAVELLAPSDGIFYDGTAGTGGTALEALRYSADRGGSLRAVTVESDQLIFHLSVLRAAMRGLPIEPYHGDCRRLKDTLPEADWSIMFPPLGDNKLYRPRILQDQDPVLCSGDWFYALHMLETLKEDGAGVICLFSGSLFNTRNTSVRRYFLERNVIDAVISLPENCFPYTAVPTSLLVLRKNRRADEAVLMVDAAGWMLASRANQDFQLLESSVHELLAFYRGHKEGSGAARVPPAKLKAESLLPKQYQRFVCNTVETPDFGRVQILAEPPDTWLPLAEGAEISNGINIAGLGRGDPADIGVIRLSDVRDGALDPGDIVRYTVKKDRVSRYQVQENDILVSCKGSAIKACLIPATTDLLLFSHAFLRVRVNPNYLMARYVLYFLLSPAGQYAIAQKQVVSSITILRAKDLAELRLPYIPLPSQKQCVEQLLAQEEAIAAQMAGLQRRRKRAHEIFYRQTGLNAVIRLEETI